MITEKEVQATKLSPTKKDFYQIWNELLEIAGKISERWDPTSTNESDPGIVLLKVLTACADKLNYNIDKNILEAFMPSATQVESMRRLCEMMGYNVKYYRSATTKTTLVYTGENRTVGSFTVPAYSIITDEDNTVNYITLEPATFYVNSEDTTTEQITSVAVNCIEGTLVQCETNTGDAIGLNLLDDNFRYYLPEVQIAENKLFVISTSTQDLWEKVDNLNTQVAKAKVFKFGYDSAKGLPYLQFPDDIGSIIEDGLKVLYIRTAGANGNVSAKFLTKIESFATTVTPSLSSTDLTTDDFIATNASAATNGTNIETIDQAYENYKKTIGTFDTLVTCRDYMNKIYGLIDELTGYNLVSNCIVSDIRDDINRAYTLCSFDDYGIKYVNKATKTTATRRVTGKDDDNVERTITINEDTPSITSFDLMLYPFKAVYGVNTKSEYINSFSYTTITKSQIEAALEDNKTIAHNYCYPTNSEIVCIKNYLKLDARLTTTYKINSAEEKLILDNIYKAIYKNFNMNKLDFGEEIPFDDILTTIENADERIKNVALEEPELYTVIQTADNKEYDVTTALTASFATAQSYPNILEAKKLINKLTLRNILAGRISMFNYKNNINYTFKDSAYPDVEGQQSTYENIKEIDADLCIPITASGKTITNFELTENEVIRFRSPNFKTTLTYPAYVNYYLHLTDTAKVIAKNTDYQLKSGDWLAINYTPSSSSDSTTTAEPVNIVYTVGQIVRFNFEIKDSSIAGGTKTKTSGYEFDAQYQTVIEAAGGMYTFGTNEQVELRDFITVNFTNELAYFYWTTPNVIITDINGVYEHESDLDNFFRSSVATKYILQEGEYFYYTNSDKISMSYYGNGTEITKTATLTLEKRSDDGGETAETVEEYGINAIPWISCRLGTNVINLQEYQYINLAAGDTCNLIKFNTSVTEQYLTKAKYLRVDEAVYTINDDSNILPIIEVTNAYWTVTSKLELNFGPSSAQKLNTNISGTTVYRDKITIVDASGTSTILKPESVALTPINLKSNYYVYSSTGHATITASDEDITEACEVSLLKVSDISIGSSTLTLNNFGDNLTIVPFSYITAPFSLNVFIKNTDYCGVAMFYSSGNNEDITITASKTDCLYHYNTRDNTQDSLKLYKGINIIKITKACTITISCKSGATGNLIFSSVDQLLNNAKINPEIEYQKTDPITTTTSDNNCEEQLLKDIKAIDPNFEFYYNVTLNKNSRIELNTANNDTLNLSRKFYDYNNINNKFVISEIDDTAMKKGIVITKSSKK